MRNALNRWSIFVGFTPVWVYFHFAQVTFFLSLKQVDRLKEPELGDPSFGPDSWKQVRAKRSYFIERLVTARLLASV